MMTEDNKGIKFGYAFIVGTVAVFVLGVLGVVHLLSHPVFHHVHH
jgi:hypothetical protein